MPNIVKLRNGPKAGQALRAEQDATARVVELLAATREEVGRAIFSIDLMVQHARLIVGRISNPEARTNFEAGLRSIECALESARRIGRSI